MKRILLISHETKLNGAPRALLRIVQFLHNEFDLTVLLPNEKGPLLAELNRIHVPYVVINTIEQLYTASIIKRIYLNFVLFYKIFRQLKEGSFDICYINTAAARFAGLPGRFSKVRVIWHIREYYENWIKQKIVSIFIFFMADKIIVNSNYTKQRLGISKAEIIYNGITGTIKIENDIASENRIVFIGRICREKGVDDLLEAMALLKGKVKIILDLVGYCKQLSFYEDIINKTNLKDYVYLRGFHNDVTPYLSKACLLVHPSYREGFGQIILEAFAQSRPVIVYNVGGVPEIVDSECGILVPPGDIEGLCKAIIELVRDRNRAKSMGIVGRRKALEKFSLEANINAIRELFNSP